MVLQGMDLGWEPALPPGPQTRWVYLMASRPAWYPPLRLPEGWSGSKGAKRGQQRLSRQQRSGHGFPQADFTAAPVYESHPQGHPTQDHSLGPVASSLLSVLPLQMAGWSDLCKAPRQSLRDEAKLVLPQNNGCLSGLPLMTVTLNVQTSALLWVLRTQVQSPLQSP